MNLNINKLKDQKAMFFVLVSIFFVFIVFVFKVNGANTYTKKIDLSTANGSSPSGSLVQGTDGMFYGMTYTGGANGAGVIFQYVPPITNSAPTASNVNITGTPNVGQTLTGTYDYSDVDGDLQGVSTFQWYKNGTAISGATGISYTVLSSDQGATLTFGVVPVAASGVTPGVEAKSSEILINSFPGFSYNTYTDEFDLTDAGGNYPDGSMVQASDGNFYGLANQGGTNEVGTIFEYNPITKTYTNKYNFGDGDQNLNGASPAYGPLTLGADGKFYGMANQGGANNDGIIFQWDYLSGNYVPEYSFSDATGLGPQGSLVLASNGKFYGTTLGGGANGKGVIFQWDSTGGYVDKYDFDGTSGNGAEPSSALTLGPDGNLYGLTVTGSVNTTGVIFEYNPLTSTYTKKYDLDGSAQGTSLTLGPDGKFYGMTLGGGLNSVGVIFQWDSKTNTYTDLIDLTDANGNSGYSLANNFLTLGSDGNFYGMTNEGGANGMGVIFEFSPISITGTSNVGQTLTGHYFYSDIDSDSEGASAFQWYRNEATINGATSDTYVLTSADSGTTIKFGVTPKAQAGSTPGGEVKNDGTLINSFPVASNVNIIGTPNVGQLLTGNYTYSDADGDLQDVPTFQWYRDGVAIDQATGNTYTLVQADSGSTIKFGVIPKAITGSSPGNESQSDSLLILNSAPIASNVNITGTPNVGQLLTGTYDYSDVDGDTQGISTFKWYRDGVAIDQATGDTYTLVQADSGATIIFGVTPVAATGTTPGTEVLSGGVSTLNSAPVSSNVNITGTPNVGQTLTGTYDYSDVDGDAEGISTFQWYRNDLTIGGALSDIYTVIQTDLGSTIKFGITPVAIAGVSPGTEVQSDGLLILNSAPTASNVNTTGTPNVGQLLTGTYDYSDVDGDTQGVSTFQWYRDGVAIDQATSDTYTLVQADSGTTIKFGVTPAAVTGTTPGIEVKSGGLLILNLPPVASNVNITGTPNVGQLLSGHYIYSDTENDAQGISTFKWYRDGIAVDQATSNTYTLVQADVGKTIKFGVTPVATTGTTPGTEVQSDGVSILNSSPIASGVNITGIPKVSQVLTGHYTYSDLENDTQGISTFQWYRDGVAINQATSNTYTLVQADVSKTIKFGVTPVATTGTTPGTEVQSDGVSIISASPTGPSGGSGTSSLPTNPIVVPVIPVLPSNPIVPVIPSPIVPTTPIPSVPNPVPSPTPTPTPHPVPTSTVVISNPSGTISVPIPGTSTANNETTNVSPVFSLLEKVFAPPTIKKINVGLKVTATTFAIASSVVSFGSVMLLNSLSTPEFFLIPFRLWSLLLAALGLKKRNKPWGVVYDSITKQPLDPVYVSLQDINGKEISSSITDIDGRYGFLSVPGTYKVVPQKTNYVFPSKKLAGRFNDEFYQDLYFGETLDVSTEETIVKNIPMDPLNFDWNEFAKNKGHFFNFYSKKEVLFTRIANWLFNIGLVLAVVALLVAPEPYNIIIFVLYVFLFILRKTSFKKKAHGKLMDKNTGDPLSFAFVRVFSIATNVEISHKVADKMGRYFCLVPKGKYYVQIEKKNLDESYSVVYKSEPIEVENGILNRVFHV